MGVRTSGQAFSGGVSQAELDAAVAAVDLRAGGTITGPLAMNGDLTMGAGKVLVLDQGTTAKVGLRFNGHGEGTGLYGGASTDQIRLLRLGSSFLSANGNGVQFGTVAAMDAPLVINHALRVDAETIKTADYTATAFEARIAMNVVAGGTLTLPASPATDQELYIKNLSANPLTVARNGNTIDGAATNITLASGEAALLNFEPSGWIRY